MRRVLGCLLAAALILGFSAAVLAAKIIPESMTVSAFDLDGKTAGKVLLDVRKMEDIYQNGEIEGSLRIPLDTLLMTDKLPAQKDAAIIVVSQEGSAGELAVLGLQKLGYTNVKNLEGGISGWAMVGLPTKPVQREGNLPGGC